MTSESNNMSIKADNEWDWIDSDVGPSPAQQENIRLARELSVAIYSSKPYYQAKIKADPTYLDNFPILRWP